MNERIVATSDVENNHDRIIELQAQIKEAEVELEARKATLRRLMSAGQEAFSAVTGESIVLLQAQREFDITGAVALLWERLDKDTMETLLAKRSYDSAKVKAKLTTEEIEWYMRVKPGTEPKVIIR